MSNAGREQFVDILESICRPMPPRAYRQRFRISGLELLQVGKRVDDLRDCVKYLLGRASGAHNVTNAEIVKVEPSCLGDYEEYEAIFDSAGWTGIPA